MYQSYSMELAGRTLTVDINRVGKQANGCAFMHYGDTMYSKAYLRHLFHAQELLAMQIASIHNLAFYLWLAGEARKHIIAGDFATWKPMMVKRVSTRL